MSGPWQTHTKRFFRHKAMIQCSRLAFGYVGIYDQDEAERVVDMGTAQRADQKPAQQPEPEPMYPAEKFEENFPKWKGIIEAGKKSAAEVINTVESSGKLTAEQRKQIEDLEAAEA